MWIILAQSYKCIVLQAMHGAPLYIAETCPSQIRGTLTLHCPGDSGNALFFMSLIIKEFTVVRRNSSFLLCSWVILWEAF